MIRGFWGAMVALTTILLLPAQAEAMSAGSISVPSVTLYESCGGHPYTYNIQPNPGFTYDVTTKVKVSSPDGLEADTDLLFDTAGSAEIFLCGDVMPGLYRVDAVVDACNSNFACYEFALPQATFSVRLPNTRTSLAVSSKHPKRNQIITFTITSKDERPNGYYASDYAQVWLEKRVGNKWARVRSSKTSTDSNGKARLQYRWDVARANVRAVTGSSDSHLGSTSTIIKMS